MSAAMTSSIDILLLVLGIGTGRLFAEICPHNWHQHGDACYFIITDKMNWYTARSKCVDFGAKLAVPNSQTEQEFIWKLTLLDNNSDGFSLWIGCIRDEEGEWQNCPQKGNEERAFENWDLHEPQPYGADCGLLWKVSGGKWGSLECNSETKYAVCELPMTNTPVFCLETGNDGRLSSQCMLNHVITKLPGKGVVSCGKACRSYPQCRSFNLRQDGGKTVCELNDAAHQEAKAQGDIEETENCYFFGLE